MLASVFDINFDNLSIVHVKQRNLISFDNKQCPLESECLKHELDLMCVPGAKDTVDMSIKR